MTWTWGTVTTASPLAVLVDGDTVPTSVSVTLVPGLVVGDDVRIQLDGILIVVGKIQ